MMMMIPFFSISPAAFSLAIPVVWQLFPMTTMLPTIRGRGLQAGVETCLPTKLLGHPLASTGAGDAGVAVSDADGSVYITGINYGGNLDDETRIGTYYNAFLTKYSPSGAKEWTRLLGVDGGHTASNGVAVSDASLRTAIPHSVVNRHKGSLQKHFEVCSCDSACVLCVLAGT